MTVTGSIAKCPAVFITDWVNDRHADGVLKSFEVTDDELVTIHQGMMKRYPKLSEKELKNLVKAWEIIRKRMLHDISARYG